LTLASSGSATCPKTPESNHTYSFCAYVGGLTLPANLTNVTFYGDEFQQTDANGSGWPADVNGLGNDSNIIFNFDTFKPEIAAPPASCADSYQYGIYNETGHITGFTVEHSDMWGFGNAVDTEGSTQANPQIFKYNWLHDAASPASPCNYHTDGIGAESGSANMSYAVTDHNTIEILGNTNDIAWQNGTYSHDLNTNNLLSGDSESYAGARCTSSCTPPTYIETTGNTFNTYLRIYYYPLDNATHYWTSTGSVWQDNYWAVPPGAAWGTPGYNGYYWVPTANSNYPHDCGFVSRTDYSNYANACS
jgi:hypothetical protein